jgi:hypothetical protein
MPNDPEPPPPLEQSHERVALGPHSGPELGDGGEHGVQPASSGAGQVAIDPKLGDGDAVTHGKMKGMLQDPALVTAMSDAARRGPRDTERKLRGPKKPYFLNTQQFRDACGLVGVKEGARKSGASGAPTTQHDAADARAEQVAVRGEPSASAVVDGGALARVHAEARPVEEQAPPVEEQAPASAWERLGAGGPEPQDLPSALAPPSVRGEAVRPGPTSEPNHATQRRGPHPMLLVLGLGGAALLVAIVVMAWPSEPSSDPLRVGTPESGMDGLPTEQSSLAARNGTGAADPGSSLRPSGVSASTPSGSATAPAPSLSARASGTGSAARSAAPTSATGTHAPAPTVVPSVTSSLPFPMEGQ